MPLSLSNLEPSLAEITTLIEQMEKGELTLEQSLIRFERGIHLIKQCQTLLTEAEQKVQRLVQSHDQATLTPYHQTEHQDLSLGQSDQPEERG